MQSSIFFILGFCIGLLVIIIIIGGYVYPKFSVLVKHLEDAKPQTQQKTYPQIVQKRLPKLPPKEFIKYEEDMERIKKQPANKRRPTKLSSKNEL